jgi:hypothetical protein
VIPPSSNEEKKNLMKTLSDGADYFSHIIRRYNHQQNYISNSNNSIFDSPQKDQKVFFDEEINSLIY